MNSSRPTVYLITQSSPSRSRKPIHLGPLTVHGDIKVVLPLGNSPTFHPKECIDILEDGLFPQRGGKQYDPEVDYLVWAGGDMLAAIMTGMILAEHEIWCFKWLRYERHRLPTGERVDDGATYVPMVIDVSDPPEDFCGIDESNQEVVNA